MKRKGTQPTRRCVPVDLSASLLETDLFFEPGALKLREEVATASIVPTQPIEQEQKADESQVDCLNAFGAQLIQEDEAQVKIPAGLHALFHSVKPIALTTCASDAMNLFAHACSARELARCAAKPVNSVDTYCATLFFHLDVFV
jgi:hypothetical protein